MGPNASLSFGFLFVIFDTVTEKATLTIAPMPAYTVGCKRQHVNPSFLCFIDITTINYGSVCCRDYARTETSLANNCVVHPRVRDRNEMK